MNEPVKNKPSLTLSDLGLLLRSKQFWKEAVKVPLFLLGMLLLTMLFLRIYTRHGQSRELPDYRGLLFDDAKNKAGKRSFEVVITDSIFIVGEPGSKVLQQNPVAGSKVKKGRKIYVVVTKHNPDQVRIEDLPMLYGNIYSAVKPSLESYGFATAIKDYRYDNGPENGILEVWYNGQLIINKDGRKNGIQLAKGGTLEFILGKSSDGLTSIPNLMCNLYGNALFLAQSLFLEMAVENEAEIDRSEWSTAYVVKQFPPHDPESNNKLIMGDTIRVTLSPVKPDSCP